MAFQIEGLDGPRAIFVVRKGQSVRGYVNACPHQGTPLDWRPQGFMSEDGRHIQCTTHGALFEIENGRCIAGPCAGDGLTAVALTVDDDGVVSLSSGKKA